MGASLSGSRCNYCSSLEQPASCWQIQRRRRRKRRGGPPTYLTLLRNETQENAIAEKLQKKKASKFACLSVFNFLFTVLSLRYLSSNDFSSLHQTANLYFYSELTFGWPQQNCTSWLFFFFFFYSFSILGPTSCPVEEKNLAWRWNDCLTLHENIWYHFMHSPMSESRRF